MLQMSTLLNSKEGRNFFQNDRPQLALLSGGGRFYIPLSALPALLRFD